MPRWPTVLNPVTLDLLDPAQPHPPIARDWVFPVWRRAELCALFVRHTECTVCQRYQLMSQPQAEKKHQEVIMAAGDFSMRMAAPREHGGGA